MFKLNTADAFELGHALLDAVDEINTTPATTISIERHRERLVALPTDEVADNTVFLVELDD